MQYPKVNKRLRKEFDDLRNEKQYKKNGLLQIVQINEYKEGIFLIGGSINSPYEGSCFRVHVQWQREYPLFPPKLKFLDKVWNPYVDFNTGDICISLIQQWSPAFTTEKVLLFLISLLGQTKIKHIQEGFLNPEAAAEMMNNYPYFSEHAKKNCEKESFKKGKVFQDSERGKPEEHEIKAEGDVLKQIIEHQSQGLAKKKNGSSKKYVQEDQDLKVKRFDKHKLIKKEERRKDDDQSENK